MKDERETSATRVSRLLEYMEREGAVRIGEIPSLLHVSTVTAGRYAAALRACPWVTFGREYACESERDRKLRLSPLLRFCLLSVGEGQIRVMRYCPATGEIVRQSHTLCDAISHEEALRATLDRVLCTFSAEEREVCFLGLMVERDVSISDADALGLLPSQIYDRDALTEQGLARAYGGKRVLYVRVGDIPEMLFVQNGISMNDLRPSIALRQAWPLGSEARVGAIVKHAAEVLGVLTPDVLVLESDGGASAFGDAIARQAKACGVALPPMETPVGMSLAERELIAQLRLRLAERVLIF